ncbi:MAG: polysaccharide pyruvyl transferase family protein [Sedimentisphaerales bacterium]|nr:polysaccharide pyruvyl transferase family protein [Sedimentisphaerales bacterium]
MIDSLHILIADYVPIANKGEEAIVRGIEDMLADGRPVALGLFDAVVEPAQRDNITVFPRDWLFRFEGRSSLPAVARVLLQAAIALQLRAGIYSRLQNLTNAKEKKCRPLRDFFEQAEYVLVGHDGVFCVESCGIIGLAKRHGKRTGILGASTGIGAGRFYKTGLYRRALDESDFCVFRERISCASMKQVSSEPDKLVVGPDPAFAMRPVDADEARAVLERNESVRRARSDTRPIVAVTALETGRVFDGFRPDLTGEAKRLAHAKYLATVLDALVEKHHVFVLFLPHSVEKNASDIAAAEHVAEQMRAQPDSLAILEEDCGARLLKGIIGQCDFLVGQRTHSLIASVSMGTPLAVLTNRRDTRTHGIIGEMCRCDNQIVDMDVWDERAAARKVLDLFESRHCVRPMLNRVQEDLAGQLSRIARLVKGTPTHPAP